MVSIEQFLFNPSITQSLLWLTIVMTIGLWLGEKAKIKNFSLGVTWVLFIGIALASLGVNIDHSVAQFAKDFGLILFVYSIGLQVGPSFSPFKKNGLQLNMLAAAVVLLGCVCTIVLHYITGIDMSTLAGVMSGATTSTPSLAAAQQAYFDLTGTSNPDIATGYAVAYPLSIVGVIFAFELIRKSFKIRLPEEEKRLQEAARESAEEPVCVDITLNNPQLGVLTVRELQRVCPVIKEMVVSRVIRPNGSDEIINEDTIFANGDIIRILTDWRHLDVLRLLGQMKDYDLRVQSEKSDHLISRRIAVTRPECNGKRIRSFNLRQQYHATITRVNRAGIDLLATPDMILQLGDRLMVVGDKEDVKRVADTFGNELKRLDLPNLLPVFFGMVLGICVGLLPIPMPGMGTTFKLGLAGGSLIVAILIGHYGPYYNMVTFSTTSANMMLRQVGLTLFLAALGLSVGENFVPTVVNGGYLWIGYGFLITLIPLVIIGVVAYKMLHINYFNVVGLMIGSMTSAMSLPYAQSLSNENNQASICYATVYPFTTFLRVMAAQLLVLIFCSFTPPDSIRPIRLPATVNTPQGEEYGPTLTIDDNTLYFVGLNREDGSYTEDVYVSRRDVRTGEWSGARRVEALSNPHRNEAPTSVSGDGRMMLVFVEGRMCYSVKAPQGWTEPRMLPSSFQLGNWQADAMISADGSAILFAANYPAEGEEKPSLNIFVSERGADGRWQTPYSIGKTINTRGAERSPFLHPDMKTLYFSSDREGTLGDLDVWVSRRLSDTCWTCWSEPENLGPQINTAGRDCWYKISADGKTAYYAQKLGRMHDIYAITLPEDKRPETITVLKANVPVAINNLLFETGSDVIMASSLPELKRIATYVATYGYKVQLAGHTDNIGQAEDNKKLSQARAESVRRQLVEYGCKPEWITAYGYGDTRPVATNETEEGRQLNRRVEITIQ